MKSVFGKTWRSKWKCILMYYVLSNIWDKCPIFSWREFIFIHVWMHGMVLRIDESLDLEVFLTVEYFSVHCYSCFSWKKLSSSHFKIEYKYILSKLYDIVKIICHSYVPQETPNRSFQGGVSFMVEKWVFYIK